MKFYFILGIICCISLLSCSKKVPQSGQSQREKELDRFTKILAGRYVTFTDLKLSSDKTHQGLSLVPIWEDIRESRWLYAEKTEKDNLSRPISQLVYKITIDSMSIVEIAQYQIPNQEEYIGGSFNPEVFNKINPDLLRLKKGCSVFLNKTDDRCYIGKTRNKSCKSKTKGISYLTSSISVCPKEIVFLDQGWSAFDELVSGPEKGGIIFQKSKR